jgi:hypothetical protein
VVTETPAVPGDVENGVKGPGGDGGGEASLPSPPPPQATPAPRAATLPRSESARSGAGDDAGDDTADRLTALQADLDAWWWRHVAWMVDMGAFCVLCAIYVVALLAIFASPYLSARRAKAAGTPDGSAWLAAHDTSAPGGLLMPAA